MIGMEFTTTGSDETISSLTDFEGAYDGSVFLVERNREKHLNAPLLAERERYLAYLFGLGTPHRKASCVRHAGTNVNILPETAIGSEDRTRRVGPVGRL
jgi:hypothetical protein